MIRISPIKVTHRLLNLSLGLKVEEGGQEAEEGKIEEEVEEVVVRIGEGVEGLERIGDMEVVKENVVVVKGQMLVGNH